VRAALAVALVVASGCAGRYAAPRTVAALGSLAVVGGSAAWAGGEATNRSALVTTGFFTVAAGVAAIVVAGGWMALSVSCNADPDCDEDEQCREIPAPPGGVPYKQCMSH
jgi:hypothetical protein